jgi:hypothetical protein
MLELQLIPMFLGGKDGKHHHTNVVTSKTGTPLSHYEYPLPTNWASRDLIITELRTADAT